MSFTKIVLITVSCFFLFISCTQSKIEIGSLNVKIIQVEKGDGSFIPQMSIFFSYKNELGQNDFSKIKILHIETGITWNINSQDLYFFKNKNLLENEFIVGTNKVAFPYGKVLSGEYKVFVSKLNSESFIKNFSIKKSNLTETVFPVKVILEGNNAKILTSAEISRCVIMLLAADMQVFYTKELQSSDFKNISLNDILTEKDDTRYVQFLFEISQNEFLSKIIPTDLKAKK